MRLTVVFQRYGRAYDNKAQVREPWNVQIDCHDREEAS